MESCVYPFSRPLRPAQVKNGGSYVVLVPSWLAIADRAVADDARLLADVRVRSAHVPEQLIRLLQRRAQGRDIITSEKALPAPTQFPSAWQPRSFALRRTTAGVRFGSFSQCSCLP